MKNQVASLLIAAGVAVAVPSGQAQTITVDDPNSAIWDLTTISELHVVSWDSDDTGVELEYEVDFSQDGAGKLAGAGSTQVWLNDGEDDIWFQAPYTLSGSISSSRGTTKISRKATIKGTANLQGALRKVSATQTLTGTIVNATRQVSVRAAMKASASGLGGFSEKDNLSMPVPPEAGDGDWSVVLSPVVAGTKITGQATLTLATGPSYPFTIKGSYKVKTQTSSLSLSGLGASKGSSLKVTLVRDTITAISGKVSGQQVSWKAL